MPHVLVVEDDEDLAIPLANLFSAGSYRASVAATAAEAFDQVAVSPPDVVLLDLMLPDEDGLEVCARLRREGFTGGVVIVSARDAELDVVAGLDAGADDYLTKPCSIADLQSRVRSVLRRVDRSRGMVPAPRAASSRMVVSDHHVSYDGADVVSRGRTYDVLAMLIESRGNVVTREDLMDQVWGPEWSGSPMVLPNAIGRIRERLAAVGAPDRVESVRGIGYRLTAD